MSCWEAAGYSWRSADSESICDARRAGAPALEEIVGVMPARYGKANRIRALDRGTIGEDNVGCLKQGGRRYIAGTPNGMRKRFERDPLPLDWTQVHEGLGARLVCSRCGSKRRPVARLRWKRSSAGAIGPG